MLTPAMLLSSLLLLLGSALAAVVPQAPASPPAAADVRPAARYVSAGTRPSSQVVGPTSAYAAAVLADQPVGYWRLNEASGTEAADSSTNRLDGRYVIVEDGLTLGVPGIPTGPNERAILISGAVCNCVVVEPRPALNITGPLTVEAWIKRASIEEHTTQQILVKGQRYLAGLGYGLVLDSNDGVQFQVSTSFELGPRALISDTDWHHVVGVYVPGAEITLYVDGTPRQTITNNVPAALTDVPDGLRIGSNAANTETFRGSLDEVAVYTAALGPERIREHYQLGAAAPR